MRHKVIGIAGAARTGKDTTADFILAKIGGYKYSLAQPIREMLRPLGIHMEQPYWKQNKEKTIPAFNASPRRIMQTLGTEWGRQTIDPNIWLNLMIARLHGRPGMIIPDVRFDNEAKAIRDRGGIIIHLTRDSAPKVEAHASENGVKAIEGDYHINNNGDLESLQQSVNTLLDEIYGG